MDKTLTPTAKRRRTPPVALLATAAFLAVSALVVLASQKAQSIGFGTLQWQRAILKSQQERDYGESPKGIAMLQEAWRLAQKLGKDHPFYTITLRHLSDSAWRQNKFAQSRDYALQELELLKPLGPDYQDLVPIFTRLADIDIVENKLESASKYLKEAQTVKDKAMFNLLGRAEIVVRQSVVALAQGKQSEWEALRKRAEDEWIATKVAKPGTSMSEYGYELGTLSFFSNKKMLKPLRAAALYYTQRGVTFMQNERMDNLAMVHGYERLADVYGFINRTDEKLALWKQTAALCARSKNLTAYEKTVTLCRYGKALVDKRNYIDAIQFLEQCLPLARECGDQDLLNQTIFYLQFAYMQTNRSAEALPLKRELMSSFAARGQRREAESQRREIEAISAAQR